LSFSGRRSFGSRAGTDGVVGLDPSEKRFGNRFRIRIEDDFGEHARRGGRNFLRDLVRLELDERFVLKHEIAHLPQPRADDRLGAFLFVGDPDFNQLLEPH